MFRVLSFLLAANGASAAYLASPLRDVRAHGPQRAIVDMVRSRRLSQHFDPSVSCRSALS